MVFGVVYGAVASGCEPTSVAAVEIALTEAEAAFAGLDIEGFLAQSEAVRELLPCLVEPASAALAAHVLRVEGVRAFGERSVDAVRWFAAARAIDPVYRYSDSIAPQGSPLLDDYYAMEVAAGGEAPLPAPLTGVVRVDGVDGAPRPTAWPALVQWIDGDGRVAWTVLVRHGEPLPVYPLAPAPLVAAEAGAAAPVVTAARGRWLGVGAGAAAVATAGLYAGAALTRRTWNDPATPDAQLDALKARTNGLVVASGVTGAVAVGLGVGVAARW